MPRPMTSAGLIAAFLQDRRDGALEHFDVVIRVLQRPIRFEAHVGIRQPFVDDAVSVNMDGGRNLAPIGDIDQKRTSRFGTEVYAYGVFGTHRNFLPFRWRESPAAEGYLW